jgi:hypothetical protein
LRPSKAQLTSQSNDSKRQVAGEPGLEVFHIANNNESCFRKRQKRGKKGGKKDFVPYGCEGGREWIKLITMAQDPSARSAPPEPPPLPAALLEPLPVIAVLSVCWVIAAVLAFAVPELQSWRPFTIAGLAVGALGTSIFFWQRHAARRGSRGAQSGLR